MFVLLPSRLCTSAIRKSHYSKFCKRHCVKYAQGQSPAPRVREYFYYVDHQGMLFLADARLKNFTTCFSDKRFLSAFFKLLKKNDTGRYTESFPYVSLCGPERNFVCCDDLPIVFTQIVQKRNRKTGQMEDWLNYAHAGKYLSVPFEPEKLYMKVESGRLYHPGPERTGGIGLMSSKLALELGPLFRFEKGEEHGPTNFIWKDHNYSLQSEWCKDKIMQATKQK